VAFAVLSKKFLALDLRIVPILEQEGHFAISGNDLKKIFNCNISGY
jgi:hypothetical protein